MPLIKSGSNAARSENIRREIDAGKPPAQAEAIGYSVQRKAKGKSLRKRGAISDKAAAKRGI